MHREQQYEIALAAIVKRKWRNGQLKQLARAALAGKDIRPYLDLTEKQWQEIIETYTTKEVEG